MTSYKIPILYTVFNRLDVVKKTFPSIRQMKPKYLFVEADGPRNKKEKEKTDAVRKYILDNVDWKCELKTRFRKKNLGSHKATLDAVNWFFKSSEKGIVLEDDDLTTPDFFRFCEELLEKYKDDKKVMSICGYNPIKFNGMKTSYYFSKSYGVWGWASWRDRWNLVKNAINEYKLDNKKNALTRMVRNPIERFILRKRLRSTFDGGLTDWTYAFLYSHLHHGKSCIKPRENLVENVGFGEDATRTVSNVIDNKFYKVPISKIKFPLKHPKKVSIESGLSRKEFNFELKRIVLKKILYPFKKLNFLSKSRR